MLTFDTFYPSDIHITDQTLLLNIETTGLSPRNAFVFMIGLGWQEEKGWHFQCLLAEKKMDERELMQSFQQILENFSQVLTYGGHSFTYRFLNNRWRNYSDADCFSSEDTADLTLFQSVRQLDIQKDISPFRHLLSLENTRKATAEAFIRYTRPEHLDPEALVKCYTSWELSKEDTLLLQLKSHHEADMIGLLHLHSLSAYTQFFRGRFAKVHLCRLEENFCHLALILETPVPQRVQLSNALLSLSLEKDTAHLVIPVLSGELKYFLPGPVKDYYYLPKEDRAIHRSIACYVDKAYRQKATAATCYIRQEGVFLPSFDTSLQPTFKKSFDDKQLYILCDTEKLTSDPAFLRSYISSLIKEVASV